MSRWEVTRTEGRLTETIAADYMQIERGVLVFYVADARPGYPANVALAIASGHWSSVSPLPESSK